MRSQKFVTLQARKVILPAHARHSTGEAAQEEVWIT